MYFMALSPTIWLTAFTIITAMIVITSPIIAYLIVETACLIFSSSPPDNMNEIPPIKINTTDKSPAPKIA